jgi:hypothetical protein
MLPLASSSGFAIISVVVLAAIACIWWLLRAEAREEAQERESAGAAQTHGQQLEELAGHGPQQHDQ